MVRVTGDAPHITRVLGMGMTVTPGQLSPNGQQATGHARALNMRGSNFPHIDVRISWLRWKGDHPLPKNNSCPHKQGQRSFKYKPVLRDLPSPFFPQENRLVYFVRFRGSRILKIQICMYCAESFRSVNSLDSCIVIVSLRNPIFIFEFKDPPKKHTLSLDTCWQGTTVGAGTFACLARGPGQLLTQTSLEEGK